MKIFNKIKIKKSNKQLNAEKDTRLEQMLAIIAPKNILFKSLRLLSVLYICGLPRRKLIIRRH